MARPKNPTPSYLKHHGGRARAVWTDASGRHFRVLPGAYGSEESRRAFGRLLLELEVGPASVDPPARAGLLVSEVIVAYLGFAKQHYRGPDGRQTSKYYEARLVCRTVLDHYGDTVAALFGALALKACRQVWVAAGLSRVECNRRGALARRMFKWAASEELVPVTVYQSLATVEGLQKGRTAARETEPVGPVADDVVDATLPHLNRVVRGMVEFQRLTGCRPGEVCRVRRADIDTTGPVWLYRPERYKGEYRGGARPRVVAIGPKAQAVLREFFTPDPGDYLFSPARAAEEVRAARAAGRKTPLYPSHVRHNKERRVKNPKRRPADRYTSHAYSVAVGRACDRAGVGRWHPNQLRHTFATAVRKRHGLEAAQVVLGHARANVTEIYAERNEGLAATVAAQMG